MKAKNRAAHFYREVAKFERSLLDTALLQHKWNRRATAQFLEISYRSLIYKIQAHGLFSPQERERILLNAARFGIGIISVSQSSQPESLRA